MSIGAIGNAMPSYKPQKASGQDDVAQLESKLEALSKQLKSIKQNDKLEPEKKKKQIADIEKKMAEIEKKILQMSQKRNNSNVNNIEDVKGQNVSKKKPSSNHPIDEYV